MAHVALRLKMPDFRGGGNKLIKAAYDVNVSFLRDFVELVESLVGLNEQRLGYTVCLFLKMFQRLGSGTKLHTKTHPKQNTSSALICEPV